jgi:large repetitive protein
MKKLSGIAVVLTLVLMLGLTGCGGGMNAVSVAVTPASAQAVDFGQSVNLTATVKNDSLSKGVTWSLSGPGALSATTTSSATYTAPATGAGKAMATATSVADTTKSGVVTIAVTAAPAITTQSLPAGVEGTAYSQTVAASGGAGTVTYSLSSGTLPAGLNLNATTGAITGTPTGPNGTANFTVKVTDASTVSAQSATQALSVAINRPPAPAITTTVLPADVEGTAYSQSVAVTGGLAPLTYSVSVGSLPAGLSLNSSTGAISGTPAGPNGTASFTIKVVDSSNPVQSTTQALSIAVNLPAAPAITTLSLPGVVEFANYNQTIAATGGLTPLTYSVSVGSLPAGLSLNSGTGAITGAPTGPNGAASFTIKVTDKSNPVQSATQALSIAVNLPAAPAISTSSLPGVVEFASYNQTIAATGFAPLTYSVSAGSLPAGLSLNSSTGAITGSPTGPNGAASFTIKVTDKSNPAQSATQALSIAVNLPAAPAISTSSLPGAVEFASYNQTIAATGFAPLTYSVSIGSLPAGLSLNGSTGAISGTPTGPNGPASFTIKVTDASNPVQSATQALSIAVNLPAAPAITTTTLPNGTIGAAYNQAVAFSGGHGPFTWSISAGTLPAGLSQNAATGAITGNATATGVSNFTVKVVDSSSPAQSASQTLSITVVNGPLLVVGATLPTGAIGDIYQTTNLGASGGLPPYTWSISVGSLPAGLALNTSTGAITGTPTGTSGTANFTAQVKDSTNATATGSFSIVVNPVLSLSTSSLPNATVGSFYSTTLAAAGGITPYNWTISVGALPAGLTLSGNTISGTPTTAGNVGFTVQVADAASGKATATLGILVNPAPPLAVTTTQSQLPAGTLNTTYAATNLSASGGIQPYTWSVVTPGTGTLPPGLSLSSSGQITGTPTSSGAFPFTAQVTDSASNTATANFSITVAVTTSCTTLTGKEALLQGDYAFVLKGFDASGNPVFLGGVFTASGTKGPGNITAGTLDMNLVSGVQTGLSMTSASSYNLGLDPNATNGFRGCMSIVTSAGTMNYRFSVDAVGAVTANVASDGHIVGFDAGGPFTSGILRQATPSAFSTSAIAGNWAFGIAGARAASGGGSSGYFAAAGVLTLASGSISGVVDTNDNGQLDNNSLLTAFPTGAAGITLSSGPYSIASNGRGTANFTPTGSSSAVTNLLYVVSSSELLILNTDAQVSGGGTNTAFTGRALKQSGTFSNSSLTGSHVNYTSGGSTNGSVAASRAEADVIKVTSGNNFTFSGYQNDGGNVTDPTKNSGSGTFSVASNGRVTLTVSGANNLPVFYLSSANTAFFLNSDSAASAGNMEPQVGSSFTNSSASGTYGLGSIEPAVPGVSNEDGTVTFTSSSASIAGTSDTNNSGTLSPDNLDTATYAISSTGVGLIPAGCTLTGSSANCELLFIVISPTKAVLLKVKSSNTTPVLNILQQ